MIHFNFENYRESLLCMLDSCVSLFLEIVFISHKIVGVAALLLLTFCNFATRMSICSHSDVLASLYGEEGVEVRGLEPLTSSLQSWRSTN